MIFQLSAEPVVLWEDLDFPTPSGKIELASDTAERDGHPRTPVPDPLPRPRAKRSRRSPARTERHVERALTAQGASPRRAALLRSRPRSARRQRALRERRVPLADEGPRRTGDHVLVEPAEQPRADLAYVVFDDAIKLSGHVAVAELGR